MPETVYVRMLKTAVGPNFGPFLAGFDYQVSKELYERLRGGFACRQVRDTDAIRKTAKAPPRVAGGGDELYAKAKKSEEEFIDAPLPEEPPPIAGIVETKPVTDGEPAIRGKR